MFDWIAKAYNWATGKVDSTVASWVHDILTTFWGFLHTLFGGILDAWNDFVKAAKSIGDGIVSLSGEIYNWVKWFSDVWWHDTLAWIHKYILGPLAEAWHWITNEGAYLWHLITHAADLVALIWDALIAQLESDAWDLGDKLGQFFLALIIKNVEKFAHLIEDVLDAIL